MKLLITGGCGFLGSNLAAKALERGDELVVLDNLSRLGTVANLTWLQGRGSFRFVQADVCIREDVNRVVEEVGPDAIFHLAGQVAMTTSIENPRLDFEINAMGALNLLEAVRAYVPDATVIYSSTNKVYGDLEQYAYRETDTRYECMDFPDGFGESTPLEFHSPYGCSKGAADQYMLDYARIFNLRTIVFRHSSMYGGRQYATHDQGWIGWFCAKASEATRSEGGLFTISGSGKQVRDVLHADDMVRLYFAAVENRVAAVGQAFNVGGGRASSLSLLELFQVLESFTGRPMKYERRPARQSDQRVFIADISKATRILGWQPRVGYREGIKRMLQWITESPS